MLLFVVFGSSRVDRCCCFDIFVNVAEAAVTGVIVLLGVLSDNSSPPLPLSPTAAAANSLLINIIFRFLNGRDDDDDDDDYDGVDDDE